MAKETFLKNWDKHRKKLKNPELNTYASAQHPFNTNSGECYVEINRNTTRASIKNEWKSLGPSSLGLPNHYQLRASDSQSDSSQIDLKVSESKHQSVHSFYNFHLNCVDDTHHFDT